MDFSSEDARVGMVLNGRYKIKKQIATGGMAVVYLGERLGLGRPVAIKFLQEVMLRYPQFISRFRAEAKAMSRLTHPHCVSVIDFGVEGAPYIVMDFVEGRTLKSILAEERFTLPRAVALTRQMLAGIAHAHSLGIIHRDIKPENVIVQHATGVGEQVRIFDFGLAKLLDPAFGVTMSTGSAVAGTPAYMSPEQTRAQTVDERTDVYSIGLVLFELLTGRKPFVSEDIVEMLQMHREKAPPSLNEADPVGVFPPALEEAVARALAKSPDDRFQSAAAFSEALEVAVNIDGDPLAGDSPSMAHAKTLLLDPDTIPPEKKASPAARLERWLHERLAPFGHGTLERLARLRTVRLPRLPRVKLPRLRTVATPKRGTAALAAVLLLAVVVWGVWPSSDKEVSVTKPVSQKPETHSKTPPKGTKPAAEKVTAEGPEGEGEKATEEEREVNTLADAEALIRDGKTEAAIAGLQKLRKAHPNVAHYHLLLGNLYFQKAWWGDAMDHYREAIRLNPSYKKRPALNRNVIQALGSNKSNRKASVIIQKSIGKAALPYLREAKNDENPLIRKRAAAILKRM